jgi:hypothetical protein
MNQAGLSSILVAMALLDQNVVDRRFFTGPRDGVGLDPSRCERRSIFFIKILAIDSIGESLKSDRAIFQVGQNVTGNSSVVVDNLAFGEANRGIHDLIQIRDANVSTRYP